METGDQVSMMHSTMMHYPMSVQMIFEHGRALFPNSRVGTFDGHDIHWRSYADVANEANSLASALQGLGIAIGDRVATFSWNNASHLAAYMAIPAIGAESVDAISLKPSGNSVTWSP